MPAYNSGSVTFGSLVSGDYRIAALEGIFLNGAPHIWAAPWLGTSITYSFPTGRAFWDGGLNYGNGEISAGWFPMSAPQQTVVRQALDAWSAVSAAKFTEVADGTTVGDLRFGFTYALTGTEVSSAYFPASDSASAGDVWINASLYSKAFGANIKPYNSYNKESAQNYQILLHEIGHALGLSHPFPKVGETRGTAPLPTAEDHYNNTVMSYSAGPHYGGIPSTPMVYDILALQYFYGRDVSHNTGNSTYSYDINNIQLLTIWDAGGEDTIAVTNNSNITRGNGAALFSVIDLNEGAGSKIGFSSTTWADPYSQGASFGWRSEWPNIYIAYGAVIENAVGTNGNDSITGNAANNKITGGLGSDSIDGGAGSDTAIYSLARSNYTLAKTGTGWTVTDNFTSARLDWPGLFTKYGDTLTNIERLSFVDGTLGLDTSGTSGQMYRLYKAAFDRVPDTPGLGHNIRLVDGGLTLAQMSSAFVVSAEFKNTYGALSNAQFINQLYLNVLDRAPDAPGLAHNLNLLNTTLTRADMLGAYSESAENQVAVIGQIQDGIWFT